MLSTAIAPQPLAAGLAEFAHQTGLQLTFVSQIATGRTSKGARAGLSPNEALTQLLDGTGLRFEFLNARTVLIYETPVVAPASQSSATDMPKQRAEHPAVHRLGALDEVIVVGLRDEEGRSISEFVQNVSASVTIVSGESLESQHFEQLSDYAGSIPGLYVAPPGQAYVNLRGISTFSGASAVGFYIDDTRIGPSGPYLSAFSYPLDLMPYELERLEVLRGPQGTQYGAASDVGMIRHVLKAPSVREFEARAERPLENIAPYQVPEVKVIHRIPPHLARFGKHPLSSGAVVFDGTLRRSRHRFKFSTL